MIPHEYSMHTKLNKKTQLIYISTPHICPFILMYKT